MTGLAQFIMRGRWQALLVAVVGSVSVLFCWISAAAVALVTLRKGAGEGAWLLLWALLPALVVAWSMGDSSYLALIAGTGLLAQVLRVTVSLSLTLLASVAVGVGGGLLMLTLGSGYLEQLNTALVEPYMAYLEQNLSQAGEAVTLPRPTMVTIAGMIGTGTASMSVLCLLLGRYWQSALYNPGGFGKEFRALRYPVGVSVALILAVLALSSLGMEMRTWAMVAMVPLSFAGLGLVHARAAHRGWSAGWVPLFYGAWLLIGAVQLMVVFLAVADSWLDFRQRWSNADT